MHRCLSSIAIPGVEFPIHILSTCSREREGETDLELARASSAFITRQTLAATLWCTIVLLSSLTISIPNSCSPSLPSDRAGRREGEATDHYVLGVQFEDVTLRCFGRESFPVDKRSIRTLDVLDKHLFIQHQVDQYSFILAPNFQDLSSPCYLRSTLLRASYSTPCYQSTHSWHSESS